MSINNNDLTIGEAADLIESTGSYRQIEIESLSEKDGNFLCKLRGPSHRTRYTYYPPVDRDLPCPTKKEAIIRCLRHVEAIGCIRFLFSESDAPDSHTSKKFDIAKRKNSKVVVVEDVKTIETEIEPEIEAEASPIPQETESVLIDDVKSEAIPELVIEQTPSIEVHVENTARSPVPLLF